MGRKRCLNPKDEAWRGWESTLFEYTDIVQVHWRCSQLCTLLNDTNLVVMTQEHKPSSKQEESSEQFAG